MGDDWTISFESAVIALILTLIIGIILAFLKIGILQSEKTETTMTAQISSLNEKVFSTYDGCIITGIDILSAVEQFRSQDIGIVVEYDSNKYITVSGPEIETNNSWDFTNEFYHYNLNGNKFQYANQISSLSQIDNPLYINPTKKYQSVICKDKNGAAIGICFYKY